MHLTSPTILAFCLLVALAPALHDSFPVQQRPLAFNLRSSGNLPLPVRLTFPAA